VTEAIERLWVVCAHAGRVTAEVREEVAAYFESAAAREGLLVMKTCHRVEVVGSSEPSTDLRADVPRATLLGHLHGSDAMRHVFRVATGLESAVLGEDQILGQLRTAFAASANCLSPEVRRLAEMALAAGREARAGQGGRPRDLSGPALRWLADRGVALEGGRILVVGAGTLGVRLAAAASARGARVLVASRDAGHARPVAHRHGGEGVDLAEAATLAPGMDGIVVALGGPWLELEVCAGLPPVVDLSAPTAVGAAVRDRLGARFADIDQLYPAPRNGSPLGPDEARYAERAEAVVEAWSGRYERWLNGRGAVPTLCSLRERAEDRRRVSIERLLRRLPGLDEREQFLISAFSRQLTAALLHEPSARLREDADGSAAQAARTLFDLPR